MSEKAWSDIGTCGICGEVGPRHEHEPGDAAQNVGVACCDSVGGYHQPDKCGCGDAPQTEPDDALIARAKRSRDEWRQVMQDGAPDDNALAAREARLLDALCRRIASLQTKLAAAEKKVAESEGYDGIAHDLEELRVENEQLRQQVHLVNHYCERAEAAEKQVEALTLRANGTCSKHRDQCHDEADRSQAWARELEKHKVDLREQVEALTAERNELRRIRDLLSKAVTRATGITGWEDPLTAAVKHAKEVERTRAENENIKVLLEASRDETEALTEKLKGHEAQQRWGEGIAEAQLSALRAAAQKVDAFGDLLVGCAGWLALNSDRLNAPQEDRITLAEVQAIAAAFNALASTLETHEKGE